MKKSLCVKCGKVIYLVVAGESGKWVTNPRNVETWHCGHDPDYPVLAHAPDPSSTRETVYL